MADLVPVRAHFYHYNTADSVYLLRSNCNATESDLLDLIFVGTMRVVKKTLQAIDVHVEVKRILAGIPFILCYSPKNFFKNFYQTDLTKSYLSFIFFPISNTIFYIVVVSLVC